MDVPDLIDYETAVEKKYVMRSYHKESSLNEVVFLRADGSLDRYVFSFPVKYEKEGEVFDKFPELTVQETLLDGKYRFVSTEKNDISCVLSDKEVCMRKKIIIVLLLLLFITSFGCDNFSSENPFTKELFTEDLLNPVEDSRECEYEVRRVGYSDNEYAYAKSCSFYDDSQLFRLESCNDAWSYISSFDRGLGTITVEHYYEYRDGDIAVSVTFNDRDEVSSVICDTLPAGTTLTNLPGGIKEITKYDIVQNDGKPLSDSEYLSLLNLTSVEEYKKFIQSQDPETLFLTEEELSVFGDLKSFVTGTYDDCDEGIYEFVDANGQIFTLYLELTSTLLSEEIVDLDHLTVNSFTDLRCPKNGETGLLFLGDVIYVYGPKGLASVRWKAGDCCYIIYEPTYCPRIQWSEKILCFPGF